jgi:hypothetical protein
MIHYHDPLPLHSHSIPTPFLLHPYSIHNSVFISYHPSSPHRAQLNANYTKAEVLHVLQLALSTSIVIGWVFFMLRPFLKVCGLHQSLGCPVKITR